MKRTLFLTALLLSASVFAAEVAKPAKGNASPTPPPSPNLMTSADFTPNVKVDNLWDGVNKDGEIQLLPIEIYHFKEDRNVGPGRLGNPICYADADNDGRMELVAASESGFVWIFKREGKTWPPKFSSGRFLHAFLGCAVTGVDVHDMDGDGIQDIVIGADQGRIFFLKGKGEGLFNVAENAQIQLNGNGENGELYTGRQLSPRIYDWNGDGNYDLIYGEGSYSANAIYILFNKGSSSAPNFRNQKPQWLAYGYGREQLAPTIADFNGDGKPDILTGALDGGLHLYMNVGFKEDQTDAQYLLEYKGEAKFADTPKKFFGIGTRPYLADLTGNKKPDLLISSVDGKVYASQFVGPMERCEFTKPVIVKGQDRLKPYFGPMKKTWYGHHEDDSYTYWNPARYGGNTGCNVKFMSETDVETGAKYSFARAYYEDGYTGTDSYLAKYYDDTINNMDYGTTYRLSFKVRGRAVKPILHIRQIYEKIVKGDTEYDESFTKDFDLSAGNEWTDCSFLYTPEFVSNRREHPAVSVSFKMNPGATNAFLDIRDIKFQRQ